MILEAMPVQLQSLSEAALVLNDPVLDVALMLRLFEALKACAENERIPKDDAVLCACVCAMATVPQWERSYATRCSQLCVVCRRLTPILECAVLLPDLVDAALTQPQQAALWKDACVARTRSTLTRFFASLAGVVIEDLIRSDEGEAEPLPSELAECAQSALGARVCIAYMGERAGVADWVRVKQLVELFSSDARVGASQSARLHAAVARVLRLASIPPDVIAAVSALLSSTVSEVARSAYSLASGLHVFLPYALLAHADADSLIARAIELSQAMPCDRTAAVHAHPACRAVPCHAVPAPPVPHPAHSAPLCPQHMPKWLR